jgi:uncharacterized cofD-like protein
MFLAPSATNARPGLKVVAIGGGSGLSALLRGLKHYVEPIELNSNPTGVTIERLSAIVTVSDDGGSSGRLRKELGVPPPGDIRNCMTALSQDEALLSRLFRYRFESGEGLDGHSFGNLFLVALAEVTGDFTEAIKQTSAILKTRGDIFPATASNVHIVARMDDGSEVHGETNITASTRRIVNLSMVPADAEPLPQTLAAIAEADLITIGPGSLFTSLVPNVLVRGIPEAIAASKAVKFYVGNLMTQPNESLGLSAAQHIRALFLHAGCKFIDYALLDDGQLPGDVLERYAAMAAAPIENDREAVRALGVEPFIGHYHDGSPKARHDSAMVARDLLTLTARLLGDERVTMLSDERQRQP